jgi:hypothetical protein
LTRTRIWGEGDGVAHHRGDARVAAARRETCPRRSGTVRSLTSTFIQKNYVNCAGVRFIGCFLER